MLGNNTATYHILLIIITIQYFTINYYQHTHSLLQYYTLATGLGEKKAGTYFSLDLFLFNIY